jgi:hypothetical protein
MRRSPHRRAISGVPNARRCSPTKPCDLRSTLVALQVHPDLRAAMRRNTHNTFRNEPTRPTKELLTNHPS